MLLVNFTLSESLFWWIPWLNFVLVIVLLHQQVKNKSRMSELSTFGSAIALLRWFCNGDLLKMVWPCVALALTWSWPRGSVCFSTLGAKIIPTNHLDPDGFYHLSLVFHLMPQNICVADNFKDRIKTVVVAAWRVDTKPFEIETAHLRLWLTSWDLLSCCLKHNQPLAKSRHRNSMRPRNIDICVIASRTESCRGMCSHLSYVHGGQFITIHDSTLHARIAFMWLWALDIMDKVMPMS